MIINRVIEYENIRKKFILLKNYNQIFDKLIQLIIKCQQQVLYLHIKHRRYGLLLFNKLEMIAQFNKSVITNINYSSSKFKIYNLNQQYPKDKKIAYFIQVHQKQIKIDFNSKIFFFSFGEEMEQYIKKQWNKGNFMEQNVLWILDHQCSQHIQIFKYPWLFVPENPFQDLKKSITAIKYICQRSGLSILRLGSQHYKKYKLWFNFTDEQIQDINLRIFNHLKSKIKFNLFQEKKKIMIFSPHPDDDVICMGGTIYLLRKFGHQVYTVYQTSGNIAVNKVYTISFLRFIKNMLPNTQINGKPISQIINSEIKNSQLGDFIRQCNYQIRKGEGFDAVETLGVKRQNAISLRLPFYESGKVTKNPYTSQDIKIIKELIQSINPDIVFAAGDMKDPHGTHHTCLQILIKALEEIKFSFKNVLLYRGAFQEWQLEKVKYIVPMTEYVVDRKRLSILKHYSQKDPIMFPGKDKREFWQRVKERNRKSAQLLAKLGLQQFQGCQFYAQLNQNIQII